MAALLVAAAAGAAAETPPRGPQSRVLRAYLGRLSLSAGSSAEVFVDPGSTSFVGAGVAPVR